MNNGSTPRQHPSQRARPASLRLLPGGPPAGCLLLRQHSHYCLLKTLSSSSAFFLALPAAVVPSPSPSSSLPLPLPSRLDSARPLAGVLASPPAGGRGWRGRDGGRGVRGERLGAAPARNAHRAGDKWRRAVVRPVVPAAKGGWQALNLEQRPGSASRPPTCAGALDERAQAAQAAARALADLAGAAAGAVLLAPGRQLDAAGRGPAAGAGAGSGAAAAACLLAVQVRLALLEPCDGLGGVARLGRVAGGVG
jgi:hypothetical protein